MAPAPFSLKPGAPLACFSRDSELGVLVLLMHPTRLGLDHGGSVELRPRGWARGAGAHGDDRMRSGLRDTQPRAQVPGS